MVQLFKQENLKGTECTLLIEKIHNYNLFIKVGESLEYCNSKISGFNTDFKNIELLVNLHLLPIFNSGSEEFFLLEDLRGLLPVIQSMSSSERIDVLAGSLFWEGITLSKNTKIDITIKDKVNSVFYSATRNLIDTTSLEEHENYNSEIKNFLYFPPARVFTYSESVYQHAKLQINRYINADPSINDFARSAHYMGSKRSLTGFIVEGISKFLPKDGIVIDLMCGSGAASSSFNNFWNTTASDIQSFCRILASIQGGGFSTQKAVKLINQIMPLARQHASSLLEVLEKGVSAEEKIFHGDIGEDLLIQYQNYIEAFPTYPNDGHYFGWCPLQQVEERKKNIKAYPYCLFTAYFANIYFGLRQCIEIDSVRFAIDQIDNDNDKLWALGALITTLSYVGTTYAAHFAQPKYKDKSDINLLNLSKILEQRSYSVFHEFSVRLMNLAEESEKKERRINTIPGPWHEAVSNLNQSLNSKTVLVYLDAPYKREEYSRYYHVLETLVLYSYPSSIGKGKVPDKGIERPRSEFFTKAKSLVNEAFVKVITSILENGWMCAWSYANSGDADIVKVIDEVNKLNSCKVTSYSTPYEHRSQGKGILNKKVTEYLILFCPTK